MHDAIIIGDIHLGSKTCQDKLLTNFLKEIYLGTLLTNQLILNGDLFDNLDFRCFKKYHGEILSLLRKLSRHVPITMIVGNRDGDIENISHLLGTDFVDEFIIHSNLKKILVIHGHQFDRYINKSFGKILKKLYENQLFLRCTNEIEEKSREYAFVKGCDAVICSHTHLAVAKPEGLSYYNTGCWTKLPTHYISVKEGRIHLHCYAQENLDGKHD